MQLDLWNAPWALTTRGSLSSGARCAGRSVRARSSARTPACGSAGTGPVPSAEGTLEILLSSLHRCQKKTLALTLPSHIFQNPVGLRRATRDHTNAYSAQRRWPDCCCAAPRSASPAASCTADTGGAGRAACAPTRPAAAASARRRRARRASGTWPIPTAGSPPITNRRHRRGPVRGTRSGTARWPAPSRHTRPRGRPAPSPSQVRRPAAAAAARPPRRPTSSRASIGCSWSGACASSVRAQAAA